MVVDGVGQGEGGAAKKSITGTDEEGEADLIETPAELKANNGRNGCVYTSERNPDHVSRCKQVEGVVQRVG